MIGRWGNFFNREAFGGYTDGLFAMQLPISALRSGDITSELMEHVVNIGGVDYVQVHPTFLYESVWNLALLLFLVWYSPRKKFNGEVFCLYLLIYGVGRFFIEGLRTDQLIFFGTGIPVSQMVAVGMIAAALLLIVWGRKRAKAKTGTEN